MKPLQVLGKYELLEKIGSGGMAEVYKARQTGVEGFEKIVVVKKVLPGYARNLSFIKMLIEEAKLTSVLQHPNIVQIFELDSVENQYYMAMEWVDGRDLLKLLAKCAESKRLFPPDIACYIAAEVCKGLHYAHNARDIYGKPLNIIHRDVSPSNVIMSRQGHIKIMDFGVAKAQTQDTKGSKHVLRGKLGYMSPEQVKGEEIDHRSDIFSLGIVLFESLTLKRLFLGRTDLETLINIRDADIEKKFKKYPKLDQGLKEVLRKALARDRDERFATAQEFHDALNDYLFQKGQRVDTAMLAAFLTSLFGEGTEVTSLTAVDTAKEDEIGETSSMLVSRPATAPNVPQIEQLQELEEAGAPVGEEEESGEVAEDPEATPVEVVTEVEEDVPEAPEPEPEPDDDEEEEDDDEGFPEEESSPKVGMEPPPVSSSLAGHEFKLKNTAGYVFGPVDYGNLVNLVQTGAVSEEEFVSIDGGDWKKVREITAVRTLSPSEALRVKGISPIYSGTLSATGILRVFYQITSRQLSGKLRLAKGSSQKEFYFRKGQPKHVSTNLKQELLGSFLLRRGVVTEEQMNESISKSVEFGGRLGDALVSMGFVKPHELYWLLDQQFKEKFIQIFTWKSGNYEFFEGVPCPIEMAPSDANVYRYIMDGVRKCLTIADLKPVFEQYIDTPIRERDNPYLRVESLPLNSKEQRLWGQLERNHTFGRVLKEVCKNDEERTSLYQLVLVLYQLELILFQAG